VSTEDQVEAAPATHEGKLARSHKSRIRSILDELLDAMESARADGFTTEFSLQLAPQTTAYLLAPDQPVMIKRW
jgi:hypothetical protein